MIGHALISDTICNGQDQSGKPDRSKSSGSLPQINKKVARDILAKKAEITNVSQVSQVNDLMFSQ